MTKEDLLSLKNKDFILACLKILSENKDSSALSILTNASECKRRFDMNYPILQEVSSVGSIDQKLFRDTCGHRRYYPDTIVMWGKRFIICNDWYYKTKANTRDTRTDFVDWVIK